MLWKSNLARSYLDKIKKELIRQVLEMPNLPTRELDRIGVEIQIHFLMSGIIDTYCEWLSGELDCTLEKMTLEVANVIRIWTKE